MEIVVMSEQVMAYLTPEEWRRAQTDDEAVEGGVRFLLVEVGGKRQVARVAMVCARGPWRRVAGMGGSDRNQRTLEH